MTPGARVAAAIEVLEACAAGQAAEQALTGWARRSRFAGSKDRAAVRDLVFDVLRRRRSCAARGGGEDPRALLIGLLRDQGTAPETLFTGEGHAPAALSAEEAAAGRAPAAEEARDLPDWLFARFEAALGTQAAEAAAQALRHRAPVILRANLARGGRARAAEALAEEGVETEPLEIAETALRVTSGARRVARTRAFADGLVELQDGASQAVVAQLPARPGRVLDLCAGGGGKALAIAARTGGAVQVHDAEPRRMRDIPARAARAGAQLEVLEGREVERAAPFDTVLCDVPCSGSGTWRRAPEAKWALTPERLEELAALQDEILDRAAALLAPGGLLAYATCSLLREENEDRIEAFLARHPDWQQVHAARFTPGPEGDGFFTAHLTRK